MKAFMGFDKDPEAALCRKGFRACENPLDAFRCYPPTGSRYCTVDIDDNGQRNSDDLLVKKIKIGAEIGLDGVIKAGARFINETCKGSADDHAPGECGNAAAFGVCGNAAVSGDGGNAAASGAWGTATVTGRYGGAKALGNDCLAAAWGPESKAMGKAGNWLVLSEHECGAIVDARLVRVDGEIIKSDTWYVLRNGKIVEAE